MLDVVDVVVLEGVVAVGVGIALRVSAIVVSMIALIEDAKLVLIDSVIIAWSERKSSGDRIPICCIIRINFDT